MISNVKFLKKRENILLTALALFLITLPLSYNFNSISAIFIGALFFVDKPKKIALKLRELVKNRLFLLFFSFF